MKIEDFTGQKQVRNESDLASALCTRDQRNSNCFWLSLDNEKFPCLSICVRDELAYAHYFPKDRHPGFHTVSANPNQSSSTRYEFYINGTGETIEVLANTIITVSKSKLIAMEFLRNAAIPTCVAWIEL